LPFIGRFWGTHHLSADFGERAIYRQILGEMDLPEQIRIGRQLNLRLANSYTVEETSFNGPYGAICFEIL